MANFAIYKAASDLATLKVGDSGSPTTYTSIPKSQTFALNGDANDEVKLSYSTTQTLNAVAITGLNEYPTITVEKTLSAVDTTLGTITGSTYAAEARARSTFNALLLFSDQDADDITLTFSTPRPIGFRTIFAGALAFQPTTNFQRGVGFVDASDFSEIDTRSSSYSQIESNLRGFNPQMNDLSESEYFDVNDAKYRIGDGVCLVVLDTSNTHPEWWMLAKCLGGNSTLTGANNNMQNLRFKEANKWL